jgi:hypothetical protein
MNGVVQDELAGAVSGFRFFHVLAQLLTVMGSGSANKSRLKLKT